MFVWLIYCHLFDKRIFTIRDYDIQLNISKKIIYINKRGSIIYLQNSVTFKCRNEIGYFFCWVHYCQRACFIKQQTSSGVTVIVDCSSLFNVADECYFIFHSQYTYAISFQLIVSSYSPPDNDFLNSVVKWLSHVWSTATYRNNNETRTLVFWSS